MYLSIFFRLYDFNFNLKIDFSKRFTVKYIIQNIDDVNFLKHSEIMFVVLYVVLSLKNPSNNVQSIVF